MFYPYTGGMNPNQLCTLAQAQQFCADIGAAGGGCPPKLTTDGDIPGRTPGIFIPTYGVFSDSQPAGAPQFYHARFVNGAVVNIGMVVNCFEPWYPGTWRIMVAEQIATSGTR